MNRKEGSRRFRSARTPAKPTTEWLRRKDQIYHLYIVEDRTLDEVVDLMKRHHCFTATRTQYQPRLHEWGFSKNKKSKNKEKPVDDATQLRSPPPDNCFSPIPAGAETSSFNDDRQQLKMVENLLSRSAAILANMQSPCETSWEPEMDAKQKHQQNELREQIEDISNAQLASSMIDKFYLNEYYSMGKSLKGKFYNLLVTLASNSIQGGGVVNVDYDTMEEHIRCMIRCMSRGFLHCLGIPKLPDRDAADFYHALQHLANRQITEFTAELDRFLRLPKLQDPLRSLRTSFQPFHDLVSTRCQFWNIQIEILQHLTHVWRAPDVKAGFILGYSFPVRQKLINAVNRRVDVYEALSRCLADVEDALVRTHEPNDSENGVSDFHHT